MRALARSQPKGELTMEPITRRTFARTSAVLAGSAALCGGAAAASASEAQAITYADTIAWDGTYDVVVIGFGLAGAVAARCAADAGAQVLLCDAAPEGQEGGSTRFAVQMVCSGVNPDNMFAYFKALAQKFDVDNKTLRIYTDGMCNNTRVLRLHGSRRPP